MINIGLYYKVIEGHEDEFERAFEEVSKLLKGSGVVTDARLYREVGSSKYMIYSEWESMEAFSEFVRSKSFKKVTEFGKTIIDGQPRHRIFAEMKGGHSG